MGYDRGPVSFVCYQFSYHHLLKRLSFPHWFFLAPLSNISWLYMQGFISGLLILLYWSMCLFLCQYHTVNYNSFVIQFEIWKCDASAFVLLSHDCFGLLWFHSTFRIFFFYFCGKCHWNFNRDWVESVNGFGVGGWCQHHGGMSCPFFLSPFICNKLVIHNQTNVLLHITPEHRGWGGGGEVRLVNAKQGRHARETENLWKSRQASRWIRHAIGPGERPIWRQRKRRISRSQPSFPRVTWHALGFPSSSNSDFPHRGGGKQKGVSDWPLGCTGHRRMDLFLSSSMDFWGKTSVTEGGGGEERKRGRQVYQRPLKEQVPCCRLQDFKGLPWWHSG